MRKLIHSSFELDLSSFKISDTEENNWFSDSFFLKYSFPFEIDLDNDLDIAFGFISQYNSDNVETYFDLLYVHGDKIEKAVLEIESMQDKLSCTLRFGFEQLPSFDKKLSELSLDNFNLPSGTTIYNHAEIIISQTWPDVNYNFPQIHVDKYDTSDTIWENFGSILNNRQSGAFLENTVDTTEDITYNRNIMQPLPYFLHILQRGMIDAGYTLSGKILTDNLFKKACIYADVDYYFRFNPQDLIEYYCESENNYENHEEVVTRTFEIINAFGEVLDTVVNPLVHYSKYFDTFNLPVNGKYKLNGTVKIYNTGYYKTSFFIKLNGIILTSRVNPVNSRLLIGHNKTFTNYPIDIEFNTNPALIVNEITFESTQRFTFGQHIADLSIYNIFITDEYGNPVPTIQNENKVNLKKAVPDITFGEFVKVIKNWFNYDLDIIDNLAVMNPIEDEINYDNAEDLQFMEVKKPLIKFSQGNSFLLKFQDIESKDYKYETVFQNKDGILNSGYIIDDKTTTIEINALPLPLISRNSTRTAHAFESNDSKIYLVKYDGLYSDNNLAKPITEYLIPAVHVQYWKNWFLFRIFTQAFSWGFKAWDEQLQKIKAKTKIFAYNRFHIIKNINKTEIAPEQFTVEIETNTLK